MREKNPDLNGCAQCQTGLLKLTFHSSSRDCSEEGLKEFYLFCSFFFWGN